MRVLILGATGMLGHMLCRKLPEYLPQDRYEIVATHRSPITVPEIFPDTIKLYSEFDVLDFNACEQIFKELRPDVVINCTGVIKQSVAVEDVARMYHINGFFPNQLASLAKENQARVINFSTDCVFNGKKGKPYHIDNVPTAEDDYGKSKLLGELTDCNCLTLRTSIVGRELERHASLIDWFLSQEGQKIKGFSRALYTGVTTLEMSKVIAHLIVNKPNLSGVYQLASEAVSKYKLLTYLNEKMDLGITIHKDEEFICDRRLDGKAFEKDADYKIPSWPEMLDDFVADNLNYKNMGV